jgi:hypothetical protein
LILVIAPSPPIARLNAPMAARLCARPVGIKLPPSAPIGRAVHFVETHAVADLLIAIEPQPPPPIKPCCTRWPVPDRSITRRRTIQRTVFVVAVQTGNPALLDAVKQALNALHTEAGQQEMPSLLVAHSPPHFEAQPRVSHYSGLGHVQERGKVIVGLQRADLPWIDLTHATPDRIGLDFDFGRALAGVIFGDPACVEFRRAALPRPNTLVTRLRSRLDDWLRAWTIFSTFVSSTWWYLGMQGQLPEYLCPRECASQLDFVSFDYYFGISAPTPAQLRRLARSVQRQFNRTAVWAGGLYQALRHYHFHFPHLPIIIAENGFADEPASKQRGEQLAAHIQAVQRAVAEGIDVRAYCVWSITSNREWGLPQEAASDFGLYYVDLDHDPELQRQPTSSVEAYRQLIAKHNRSGSTLSQG